MTTALELAAIWFAVYSIVLLVMTFCLVRQRGEMLNELRDTYETLRRKEGVINGLVKQLDAINASFDKVDARRDYLQKEIEKEICAHASTKCKLDAKITELHMADKAMTELVKEAPLQCYVSRVKCPTCQKWIGTTEPQKLDSSPGVTLVPFFKETAELLDSGNFIHGISETRMEGEE